MATRLFSRSMLFNKQTLVSVLSRSYSSISCSTRPSSLSSLSTSYLLRFRSLVAFSADVRRLSPVATSVRGFATRQTSSSLNDPNPNWSNRPPKETILLDGCDFEHWLIVMEKPEGDPTRDEIIDGYIKTLATIVGSEEEARMKIYSVSTRHYFAFGALISEELSYKVKELPKVRWVLPDSYLDVKNKDYGGEPFINGEAVPYDPKYHEEWVRNNARANERNRRNDRPRNYDRSRNFERRRTNMQNQNVPNPGASVGVGPNMGPPATNMGRMPPNMGGGPPNMGGGPPNMGGGPPNNMGGVPPNNMGGVPPNNMGGMPTNNMGGVSNSPQNWGGVQNSPENWGGRQPNNMGGGQPDMGGYRNGPMTGPNPQYQQSYAPNPAGGNTYASNPAGGNSYAPNPAGGNSYAPNPADGSTYANHNMPGRDLPPPPKYQ